MHLSGVTLTLCIIFFLALTTAAPSANTDSLTHNTKQSPLEPRGNAISVAKEKLKNAPAAASLTSAKSSKEFLIAKIECPGRNKKFCEKRCTCTFDGRIYCSEDDALEVSSAVPYSNGIKGEEANKQGGSSATKVCSKMCECNMDGKSTQGGKPREEPNLTEAEEKANAQLPDKALKEGGRTGSNAPPQVNLPDAQLSRTSDIAPTGQTSVALYLPARQKSSGLWAASLFQRRFGRQKKVSASRTLPVLPFPTNDIPQRYLGQNRDPGHLLPLDSSTARSRQIPSNQHRRRWRPMPASQQTGRSQRVPTLPFPTAHISNGLSGDPVRRLALGSAGPLVHYPNTGSTPSAAIPSHRKVLEMAQIKPSATLYPLADEASSSTGPPKFYRRGNSISIQARPGGYVALPDAPSEVSPPASRSVDHYISRVSPIICVGSKVSMCQSGCYCADDGNIACDRGTDAQKRNMSSMSIKQGQQQETIGEEIRTTLMNTCVHICGCEKDGIMRVAGYTKEEWMEIKKQEAVKSKRPRSKKKKPEITGTPAGSLETQERLDHPHIPAVPPVLPSPLSTSLATGPRYVPAEAPNHSLIRRSRNSSPTFATTAVQRDGSFIHPLLSSPSRRIPLSNPANVISTSIPPTPSLCKRVETKQIAGNAQAVCSVYMKESCDRYALSYNCGKVSHVHQTAPPDEASSSTKDSKFVPTPPNANTLTNKAVSSRMVSYQRGLHNPLVKRTSPRPERSGTNMILRNPICSRWDLVRKERCESRCYCNISGEVECDTELAHKYSELERYAHMVNLAPEKLDEMKKKQIIQLTNYCAPPFCKCPLSPPGGTLGPSRPSQSRHDADLPPVSHPVSERSLFLSSFSNFRRRGRPGYGATPHEAQLSKPIMEDHKDPYIEAKLPGPGSSLHRRGRSVSTPNLLRLICEESIDDFCQLECDCTREGQIKCGMRRIIHPSTSEQTRNLIVRHNLGLNIYCTTYCKCQEGSCSAGPSHPITSAPTSNVVHVTTTRDPFNGPSSNGVSSLHRRGRPLLDPNVINESLRPTCSGSDGIYCTARCACTPSRTIKCDIREALPAGHSPSETTYDLIIQENRRLLHYCVSNCAFNEKSLRLLHSVQRHSRLTSSITHQSFCTHDFCNLASFSDRPSSLHRRTLKRKKTVEDKLADTATSKFRPIEPSPPPFAAGASLVCTGLQKGVCNARCTCNIMGRVQCFRAADNEKAKYHVAHSMKSQLGGNGAGQFAEMSSKNVNQMTAYCSAGCRCTEPKPTPPQTDSSRFWSYNPFLGQYAIPYRGNTAGAVWRPNRRSLVSRDETGFPLDKSLHKRGKETVPTLHMSRPVDTDYQPAQSLSSRRPATCSVAYKSFCDQNCYCTLQGVLHCNKKNPADDPFIQELLRSSRCEQTMKNAFYASQIARITRVCKPECKCEAADPSTQKPKRKGLPPLHPGPRKPMLQSRDPAKVFPRSSTATLVYKIHGS